MDDKKFSLELTGIKEDIEDFSRPLSPCEYFHGREKWFNETQLKKAVEFFLSYQQEKFERRKEETAGGPEGPARKKGKK